MRSKTFWLDTSERAIKTFAQALLVVFGAGVTIISVDWMDALAIAATASLVSVLSSIVSVNVGAPGTASLVSPPPAHAKE
ncbi:holin [Corynebacterium sp. H127]|uniref:holin n=1 Tax=Corynebacterium sp. H127 TaxID=3133418 RepID=UPI0030AE9E3B